MESQQMDMVNVPDERTCIHCSQPKKLCTVRAGGVGFGSVARSEQQHVCTNPQCTVGRYNFDNRAAAK